MTTSVGRRRRGRLSPVIGAPRSQWASFPFAGRHAEVIAPNCTVRRRSRAALTLDTTPGAITLPAVPIDLHEYQAVLLDLDGTVYHEDHALPGAVDLIRRLQRDRRPYACLTNSTSSPDRLAVRLKRM